MLTVMVCLLASGNSSTRSPLASRYSVMPSTAVTRSGGAGGAGGGGTCLILRASAAGSSATHMATAATIVRKVEGIPCSLVRVPDCRWGHSSFAAKGDGPSEGRGPAADTCTWVALAFRRALRWIVYETLKAAARGALLRATRTASRIGVGPGTTLARLRA